MLYQTSDSKRAKRLGITLEQLAEQDKHSSEQIEFKNFKIFSPDILEIKRYCQKRVKISFGNIV